MVAGAWIAFAVFAVGLISFVLLRIWHVLPWWFLLAVAPLIALVAIAAALLAIAGVYQFQGKTPFK
jgi:hypothetical protein